MAINTFSLKCPECGATLTAEKGRDKYFCTYCGTQILMQNDRETVIRTIDEARLAEIDDEKEIRLTENERWEEYNRRCDENWKKEKRLCVSGFLIGVVVILVSEALLKIFPKNFILGFLFTVGVFGELLMVFYFARVAFGNTPSSRMEDFENKEKEMAIIRNKGMGISDIEVDKKRQKK